MAHTYFDNVENDVQTADEVYTVDLLALNNSQVSGSVYITRTGDELTVSLVAQGLTPGESHSAHIHGTFGEDGEPTNASVPGLETDTDGDGFIEVGEGLATYGDIIFPIVDDEGNPPTADENGVIYFTNTYDLNDDSNFVSPVTGNQYSSEDLFPLSLREVVVHGQEVPEGSGAGTEGEVDGSGGYVPLLPVATNEIEDTNENVALDLIAEDREAFGITISGTDDGDALRGLSGNDDIFGRSGDDVIRGLGGRDLLEGNRGNDTVLGGEGDDTVDGGSNDDILLGGNGDDVLLGQNGMDTLLGQNGDDDLRGGSGNDAIAGGRGDDTIESGQGNDTILGGSGEDLLLFSVGEDGFDTVLDFDVEEDGLAVSNGGSEASLFVVEDDGDAVLVANTDDGFDPIARFVDVSVEQLNMVIENNGDMFA